MFAAYFGLKLKHLRGAITMADQGPQWTNLQGKGVVENLNKFVLTHWGKGASDKKRFGVQFGDNKQKTAIMALAVDVRSQSQSVPVYIGFNGGARHLNAEANHKSRIIGEYLKKNIKEINSSAIVSAEADAHYRKSHTMVDGHTSGGQELGGCAESHAIFRAMKEGGVSAKNIGLLIVQLDKGDKFGYPAMPPMCEVCTAWVPQTVAAVLEYNYREYCWRIAGCYKENSIIPIMSAVDAHFKALEKIVENEEKKLATQ